MYLPRAFEETRVDIMHDHIRRHPLATLVTLAATGLTANMIPLHLKSDGAGQGVLQGHVARANPLWRDLANEDVLAVFHGPQHYVSPSWYASKKVDAKVVPTWNYAVVQAAGKFRVIDDARWLRGLLETLTAEHERQFEHPWAVSDAPADYVAERMKGIVGIEITISRLTGKWKVSQNQPADNRAGVVAGLRGMGGEEALAMAALVSDPARDLPP